MELSPCFLQNNELCLGNTDVLGLWMGVGGWILFSAVISLHLQPFFFSDPKPCPANLY